jgi:hypothetical protein
MEALCTNARVGIEEKSNQGVQANHPNEVHKLKVKLNALMNFTS